MLRLTFERDRREWSKSEVSRRSGLALPTISNLEAGKLYAWPGWKQRLSEVFGIPGDDLFKEVTIDDLLHLI